VRLALLLSLVVTARAFAGPVGAADPQNSSPTGFPGAYLGSAALALADDPTYGSRLLDAFDTHLQAVSVMTSPQEVYVYLEQSAAGSEDVKTLRAALGREPLDTVKASALLLADALTRPAQCREVLDELEGLKPGVGKHAASLMRGARGAGDKRIFAALHEAGGALRRGEKPRPYMRVRRLGLIFDDASSSGREGLVLDEPVPDAAPAPRPRASDLARPARP